MVWSRDGAKPPPNRVIIAYEQALPGALAAGQEKEGELATTSLEFEYLHRKIRCKMLTSNDVIILGTCFLTFVYIRTRLCFALTDENLTAESKGSHRGIRGGIQIPERKLQAQSVAILANLQ